MKYPRIVYDGYRSLLDHEVSMVFGVTGIYIYIYRYILGGPIRQAYVAIFMQ